MQLPGSHYSVGDLNKRRHTGSDPPFNIENALASIAPASSPWYRPTWRLVCHTGLTGPYTSTQLPVRLFSSKIPERSSTEHRWFIPGPGFSLSVFPTHPLGLKFERKCEVRCYR